MQIIWLVRKWVCSWRQPPCCVTNYVGLLHFRHTVIIMALWKELLAPQLLSAHVMALGISSSYFFFNISPFDEAETRCRFYSFPHLPLFFPFTKFLHRKEDNIRETVINVGRTWARTEPSNTWCEYRDQRCLHRKKNLTLMKLLLNLKHSCKQLCLMNRHISKDRPFPF